MIFMFCFLYSLARLTALQDLSILLFTPNPKCLAPYMDALSLSSGPHVPTPSILIHEPSLQPLLSPNI